MPLDAIERDDHIVEDWPEPEDPEYSEDEDYEDEDDWDDYADDEGPQDYEVKFKLLGATEEEVRTISRYLFDAIAKELEIPYTKLEDLEIEED
jgi:hypothetical protein